MHFDDFYFQDEIREGFYIPGMVKRSWAMQLEVLEVVRSICEKHNIKWFADCGTLLGAARHRGFIPWDDDLDICMFRDEYIRFNKIIEAEVPEGYKVINIYNEPEYDVFLTRIVASSEINISNDFLNTHHGFPYTAGIDVFALDYLYPDEDMEKARRDKALAVWRLVSLCKESKLSLSEADKTVFELTGFHLDRKLSINCAFVRVLDKIFSEYDGRDSVQIAPMHDYIQRGVHQQEISWYDNIIELPFETTSIKVPAAYEKLLSARYGNEWYRAYKNGGAHDYPYYTEQEETLLSEKKNAPYIYRFNGIGDDVIKARDEHATQVNPCKYMINRLFRYDCDVAKLVSSGDYLTACEMLTSCQNVAIELGTAIENEYGEGTDLVKALERYCENVFTLYSCVVQEDYEGFDTGIDALNEELTNVQKCYFALTGVRKEVLFAPATINDWEYLKGLYSKYEGADDVTVYVMPAFYASRANDGSLTEIKSDFDKFPSDIRLVNPESFDFGKHHLDEIIIANPFDEYQSGFSLHPYFYASSLYKYTDCLTYCQCFDVDDINDGDEKSLKNARHYVISPGVMLADKVYVPTENIKKVYCDLISRVDDSFSEGKIQILTREAFTCDKSNGKKILIFNVTEGDLLSYKYVIEKIGTCLDTFAKTSDKLEIIWAEDEGMLEDLQERFQGVYETYTRERTKFINMNIGQFATTSEAKEFVSNSSGYYGSSGYLMNLCIRNSIPVMLWDKGEYNEY